MDTLKKHEIFEIEVLEKLKNAKLLEPLVFGGGTMLRLCYELNRYSADLDFWFIKRIDHEAYFSKLSRHLRTEYEITDAKIKHFTLLFEFRTKAYPKRLKIEIRKKPSKCDFQQRIAFSQYSNKQVILRVHTLNQAMKNKIAAATDRGEMRDFFDLEFLLRRGMQFSVSNAQKGSLKKRIDSFTAKDYSITLGAYLGPEMRKYYIANKFSYLKQKLNQN